MIFTLSSVSRFPSIAYATKAKAASDFGPVTLADSGRTNYDPNAGRWGDYSWAVMDPSGTSVWGATEYVPPASSQTTDGRRNWGTRVLDISTAGLVRYGSCGRPGGRPRHPVASPRCAGSSTG